jgi:hypothetical protein
VSCACHWTVNVAASSGHAKLYADAYSIAPSGIFRSRRLSHTHAVRPCRRADLGGFQSGSHYSTIQALGAVPEPAEINLTFEDGMLFRRLELLIEGRSQAAGRCSAVRTISSSSRASAR